MERSTMTPIDGQKLHKFQGANAFDRQQLLLAL